MHKYLDAGLSNVWLRNGVTTIKSTYGDLVEIAQFRKLSDALARAVLRKPAPLSPGEFLWLRMYAGLTQKRVGELLDRTEHLVSLVERGSRPIETLFDREFRRAVAEVRGMSDAVPSVVQFACNEKNASDAIFEGSFERGRWSFSVSVSAVTSNSVSVANVVDGIVGTLAAKFETLKAEGHPVSFDGSDVPTGDLPVASQVEHGDAPEHVSPVRKIQERFSIHAN
jgi:hypothetical protein